MPGNFLFPQSQLLHIAALLNCLVILTERANNIYLLNTTRASFPVHGSRRCTSPLTAVESGGKFISSAKNDASSEVPSSANTNAWAYKDGKLLMLKNSNSSRVACYHLDDQVVFIRIIKSHGLSNVVSLVYEYASFQRKKGFIVFSLF